MTEVKKFEKKLKSDVRFLHLARLDIKRNKAAIALLNNKIAKSPEGLKTEAIKKELAKSVAEASQLEKEVKESGLAYWNSDESDRDGPKKIHGGTINSTKDHYFDEDEVLIWAEKQFSAAVIRTVSVDTSTLKTLATAQYKKGKGEIKIPSYTITETPIFKIAADLSQYQEEQDEK